MTPPQGWAELLAWMKVRSAAGTIDPEEAWQMFRALSATSEHTGLAELALRFRAAPAADRLALAGTIASMLAPVEWPAAWNDARWQLWHALDELVRETSGFVQDQLPRMVNLENGRLLYMAGWSNLVAARDMLRLPCRRDELHIVAKLCSSGNMWCSISLREALMKPNVSPEQVATARTQYAIKFDIYAQAARNMNSVCGVALFTGLDLGDKAA